MDKNTMFNVRNRSAGMVVYSIPEKNIRREFASGETKKISFEELELLTYQAGGRTLMENFLQIQSDEATNNLNIHTEPEYKMTDEEIKNLMLNGSMDAFLDCLDFAPVGVIDLIKQLAVSLPLNDMEKREAIKNKFGFDVTKAIENSKIDEEENISTTMSSGRRVKIEEEKKAPARRTNYKVVDTQE